MRKEKLTFSFSVARNNYELSCRYASAQEASQDTGLRGVFHRPRGGGVAPLSPANERELRQRLKRAGEEVIMHCIICACRHLHAVVVLTPLSQLICFSSTDLFGYKY